MKTIYDITLYDLMAEDLDVWIGLNQSFGFDLEIDNDRGVSVILESGIHPYAAESFAELCRRYLICYETAVQRSMA